MKYRFVKKRPEISTEEINSLRDFDSVLKGSRRILDFAYKGKLLWTLTIPVAIVVYTLVVNQTPVQEPQDHELNQPAQEEVPATPLQEQEADEEPKKPEAKPEIQPTESVAKKAEPQKPIVEKLEQPLEQPTEDNETSEELIKEDIYLKAEPKMGFKDFYAFIDNELTYPELARKDSIQGHVKVLFSIDKAGAVSGVTVLESLGDLFDNEAIRVIKRIPEWNPATFNGEPVPSRMSLKLTFKFSK